MSQLERRDDAATSVVDAFLQAVGDAVLRMGRLLIAGVAVLWVGGAAAEAGPPAWDPPGFDRAAIHGRLNAGIADSFDRALAIERQER
ncbi:hypothetical protein GAY31_03390 [Azospirillum brasilense]|nr:hypothetical protein [Azospirillum brasilense]